MRLDQGRGLLVVLALEAEAPLRREHERRLAGQDLGGEGQRHRRAVRAAHRAAIINRCIGAAKRIGGAIG